MKTGKILLTALASLALSTAAYAADGNGTEKRNVYLADWTPQNPKAGEAIYINLTQPNPYGQGVHTTNEFIRILDNSGSLTTQNFTKKNDYLLGYNSLSNIGGEDVDTWKDYKLDEKGRKMFFVNGVTWFTNIENKRRNEKLDLYKRYSFEDYPKYDNFLGFNIDKVTDIPVDNFIDIEIPDEEYEEWKKVYGDDLVILE